MSKTNIGGDAIDRKTMTASLPVSSGTPVSKLAGAIWKYAQDGFRVDLRAVGAGAVNQAVKAFISARMMASGQGKDFYLVPTFQTETIGGEEKTIIRMFVVSRSYANGRVEDVQ